MRNALGPNLSGARLTIAESQRISCCHSKLELSPPSPIASVYCITRDLDPLPWIGTKADSAGPRHNSTLGLSIYKHRNQLVEPVDIYRSNLRAFVLLYHDPFSLW